MIDISRVNDHVLTHIVRNERALAQTGPVNAEADRDRMDLSPSWVRSLAGLYFDFRLGSDGGVGVATEGPPESPAGQVRIQRTV